MSTTILTDYLAALHAIRDSGRATTERSFYPALAAGERYDVYLNERAYWANIPARVWAYTLGGYQVIKKWLSYREYRVLGRALRPNEAAAVTDMARRIAAILALEPSLDASYAAVKADTAPWRGGSPA
jgi:hypothetical protein